MVEDGAHVVDVKLFDSVGVLHWHTKLGRGVLGAWRRAAARYLGYLPLARC